MRRMLLTMLLLIVCAGLAQAGDKEDIEAVINEYNRLDEVGDMMAQARLMTADRLYVFPGGRYTSQANQTWNMKMQQEGADRAKKLDPGSKSFITAVDPVIRVYGTAAVANYIRYTVIIPSAERTGPPPQTPPIIITLVLVKEAGAWKIALSHFSPVYPPTSG